jgi:hypothetical protein
MPISLQVPATMLSPNLHIALCRLRRQERERGGAAEDGELYLERFMRGPRSRVKANLVTNCDHTYVCHREIARRPLWAAQVEHGCLSRHGGLADDCDDLPGTNETGFCLVRKGLLLTKQTRTAKLGLLPADARIIVRAVCNRSGCQQFVACIPDLLDWVQVIAHHSACTPGCILRSKAAPPYLRTYPSSFVSLAARSLIPLQLDARQPTGGVLIAYLHQYVQLQPGHPAGEGGDEQTDDPASLAEERAGKQLHTHQATWAGPYALVELLAEQTAEVMCGTRTRIANKPAANLATEALYACPLSALCKQQIVLDTKQGANILRFLDCTGKHIHS